MAATGFEPANFSFRSPGQTPTPPTPKAYTGFIRKKANSQIDSRKDAAVLAQLRSGHCLGLAHYRNRIDPTKSALCSKCEEEDETVKHWIGCPASTMLRESIYGRADLGLDVISKHPKETLAYAEKTISSDA